MRTALRKLGAVLRALGAAVVQTGSGSPEPAGSSPPFSVRYPYGRLYRSSRVRDVYLGALSLAVVCSLVFSPLLLACNVGGETYSSAMAGCQAARAKASTPSNYTCVSGVLSSDPTEGFVSLRDSANNSYGAWNYCLGVPAANVCSQATGGTMLVPQAWTVGNTFNEPFTDPTSGVTVQCTMSVVSRGPPTQNPYSGQWETKVTFAPNPNPAGGNAAQNGVVQNPDGSTPNPPIPNMPVPLPGTLPAVPKLSAGGSSYDFNSDTFTAVDSGGNQVGVSGNDARSPAGSCVSSSSATICAGSPTAPSPPAPPGSPITDPSNSLHTIDTYTQQNPSTGVTQNVTTVVYGTAGNKTSSGQASGDQGPASSSSSGGSSCTAGKICNDVYVGAACGYDPSATGDPLLSAIAVDMHHVRCSADANNLSASDFASADHTLGDQTQTPDSVFSQSSTTTDPTTVLDSSGFLGGGRACPGFPDVEFMGNPIITDTKVCDIFGMWGAYILAMGYVLGAIILYRGRAS